MNIAGNPRLLDLLASAYALGTLRGGARRRFEALAREQATVRAASLLWRERLAGFTELQAPVQPDPAVWVRIQNLVEAEQAAARARMATPAPQAGGWLRNLWLWRGAALAGVLATVVSLRVGFDLRKQLASAPTVQYVAVLADGQAKASLLVTFDPRNRQLVLQRVGDYVPAPDKSLQLWALPPGGAAPRSLGVLTNAQGLKLPAAEADVRAVPALAISLEPLGGVPSAGGPTGPVLFSGALIEKTL